MKTILTTSNRRRLFSLTKVILPIALIGALTGCTTTMRAGYHTPPSSVAKGSFLDTLPSQKDRDRIKQATIVSVNSQPAGTEEARLRPGSNRVKARFTWPNAKGREVMVNLNFRARENQRYYLKYICHPHVHAGETMGDALDCIGEIAVSDSSGYGVFPAVVLSPAIVGVAYTGRAVKNSKAPTFIDIFVISEDRLSEGVVNYVRVFSDGLVEPMKWD